MRKSNTPVEKALCFQLFTGQFYHWHLNPSEPLSSITFFFPAGSFPSTSLGSRGRTHGGLQTLWHRPPSPLPTSSFPTSFLSLRHMLCFLTCWSLWSSGSLISFTTVSPGPRIGEIENVGWMKTKSLPSWRQSLSKQANYHTVKVQVCQRLPRKLKERGVRSRELLP